MTHSPEIMRGARVSVAMLAIASGTMALIGSQKQINSVENISTEAVAVKMPDFLNDQINFQAMMPEVEPAPVTTTTINVSSEHPARNRASRVSKPRPQSVPVKPSPPITGTKLEWMVKAGIAESDYSFVDYIISHESGWNPANVSGNNCIGLGQNCPTNGKYFLKEACPNWQSDPVCQLGRFAIYAGKYGGWSGSYQHWLRYRSW